MKTKVALAVSLCLAALAILAAQPASKGRMATLTADDYVEIQQLVARYGFALDTAADNGYMYADLYIPDGVFNEAKGRDALAALARGGRRGPLNVRNFGSQAIIKPSAEGATGLQYAQAINFGEAGQPTELDHFGHYEDVYVKTADGWRFKSRRYVNESGSLRPAPAASNDSAGAAQAR